LCSHIRSTSRVRQFYRRWGFEDVPFDPSRSMIERMIDLEKSGIVCLRALPGKRLDVDPPTRVLCTAK